MRQLVLAFSLLSLCAAAGAQTGSSPATTSAATGVGGSGTFSGWLSDYQQKHQGRVSRQAYLDEVGRRWDVADKDKKGLTVDQINQTYGMGATGTAGVNPSPGNMGPNNAKK